MKKLSLLIIFLFCLSFLLFSSTAESGQRLVFKQNGFSINSLEPDSGPHAGQPLIMMLPPVDGFTPYINIQIQEFDGSLSEYLETSKEQFKKRGWTIIKAAEKENYGIVFEYTGVYQGNSYHWYARAVKADKVFYLITASCLNEQWEKLSPKLIECVNSFNKE